jgi:hypothetical protein
MGGLTLVSGFTHELAVSNLNKRASMSLRILELSLIKNITKARRQDSSITAPAW